MRNLVPVSASGLVLLCGLAFGQGFSEFGAVAAGSAVGGAAGKAVSNALTGALRGVDKASGDAAQTGDKATPLEVAPGQPAADLEKVPQAHAAKALPSFKALTSTSRNENKTDKLVDLTPAERAKAFEAAPMIAALFDLPSLPEALTPKGNLADALPVIPLMPPPVMTAASFKNVTSGMSRSELLHLGAPSFKVTMDEDGHLAELYSYHQEGQRVGSVKLVDGAVAAIRP